LDPTVFLFLLASSDTVAKREYNDLCREQKRTDLVLGSDVKEEAPPVKF
jgi:hypothetical protein